MRGCCIGPSHTGRDEQYIRRNNSTPLQPSRSGTAFRLEPKRASKKTTVTSPGGAAAGSGGHGGGGGRGFKKHGTWLKLSTGISATHRKIIGRGTHCLKECARKVYHWTSASRGGHSIADNGPCHELKRRAGSAPWETRPTFVSNARKSRLPELVGKSS